MRKITLVVNSAKAQHTNAINRRKKVTYISLVYSWVKFELHHIIYKVFKMATSYFVCYKIFHEVSSSLLDTLPTAEILSGKNACAWVSVVYI